MAVRQPSSQRQTTRPRQVQQQRYSAPPKRKAKIPWWGWCLIAVIAMKGCGTADAIYTEHTAPSAPTATTIQGGQ